MTKALKIVELGDPILFKKAAPIPDVLHPDIQTLIDQMIETLKHANGVGLAAPQAGVSKRLYLVWPDPVATTAADIRIVINPKLTQPQPLDANPNPQTPTKLNPNPNPQTPNPKP